MVAEEKLKPIRFGSYGRLRIPDHEIKRLLKNDKS
jgi:hypothetical protein